ncbi:hypothetical protein PAMP_007245 [Pampus punctatissimus]
MLFAKMFSLSTAKRKFADSLNEFKFQCIGDAVTDDEICIAKSLQEFAAVLQNLEDERTRMIENANDVLIMPLERFRKEQISAAKEAKKKYDKETEKYCAVLEKHLSLSAKKKESHLHEADNQVDNVRQHFYEVSLEYVFKVQEVQERKMFDFVEPLLAFLQGLFTYYHHGYELAKDFNHFKTDLTISIQNTRNRFESTRSEVECLMRKMKENPHEHKSSFVSTWVKYYCTYHREPKRVTMVLFDPKSGGKTVYNLNKDNQAEGCIDEQGLYRIVGVSSKVQKLLNLAMDPKTCADVELDNPEWEIKTMTSAIKHYLRMLPAPLMTYQYQRSFIKAAKLDNQEARVTEIHALVHRLPEKNRQMLELLMKHLAKSDQNLYCHQYPEQKRLLKRLRRMSVKVLSTIEEILDTVNLMTIANLGVVFGPTLLRPQEETVAAIMDIKFQNIVVEILIEHHDKIFRDMPSSAGGLTNMQRNLSRRRSTDSKVPSCSERPLTLFHTPTHSQKGEKRNSVVNATVAELQQPVSSTANCNSSSSSSSGSQGRTPRHSLTSNDGEPDTRQIRPSSLLNPKSRCSIPTNATSPSPTSPRSPSWPMFSAPSSPQPTSSTSSDSSPVSIVGRKARALYACKAEHDSELSFIAGTIFENVHSSREPGWLEGTLDGRTGLIPENYVEFL